MENEIQQTEIKSVPAKPNKIGIIPKTQIDLGKVATGISNKWQENNWLTLQWKKQVDFKIEVEQYNKLLTYRLKEGAERPQLAGHLGELNTKIDDSLIYVKSYILEKYKKTYSKNYYPAFGFVHKKKSHVFPTDQNARLESLKRMVEAIEEHGFENREYGLDFWKRCYEDYEKSIQGAIDNDSSVSMKVGDKNVLKKEIIQTLNAIVMAIKINYPQTYKEQLRGWGFQKEKY